MNKSSKGQGHRSRLRERFLQSGLDGFLDYEVVELLLTLATPRKDCKDTAKLAIKQFKNLQGVLSATREDLTKISGIGPKNALGILLIQEVSRRYLKSKVLGLDIINSPKALFDYLYHLLRDRQKECFMVIYLDPKNRVREMEILFEGTVQEAAVYPREVAKAALDHNASSVMIVHNHPSGDPAPSKEDMSITREIMFSCLTVEIQFHEHLIIGNNTYYSFAENQQIKKFLIEYNRLKSGQGL